MGVNVHRPSSSKTNHVTQDTTEFRSILRFNFVSDFLWDTHMLCEIHKLEKHTCRVYLKLVYETSWTYTKNKSGDPERWSAGVRGSGWDLSHRASLVRCWHPHLWSINQCRCLQSLICRRKGWTSLMVKRYLVFPEFLFSSWSLCFVEHAVSCCFSLPHVLSFSDLTLFVWRHEAAVSPCVFYCFRVNMSINCKRNRVNT